MSATQHTIRPRAARRWLDRNAVPVAWFGLVLALLNPPHGTGITVCWFKVCSDLPCPGCGLTRSLSCALRGMFTESWNYHPLGSVILVLFLGITAFSLLPQARRELVIRFMEGRSLCFNLLYWLFVTAFLAVGVLRCMIQLSQAAHIF